MWHPHLFSRTFGSKLVEVMQHISQLVASHVASFGLVLDVESRLEDSINEAVVIVNLTLEILIHFAVNDIFTGDTQQLRAVCGSVWVIIEAINRLIITSSADHTTAVTGGNGMIDRVAHLLSVSGTAAAPLIISPSADIEAFMRRVMASTMAPSVLQFNEVSVAKCLSPLVSPGWNSSFSDLTFLVGTGRVQMRHHCILVSRESNQLDELVSNASVIDHSRVVDLPGVSERVFAMFLEVIDAHGSPAMRTKIVRDHLAQSDLQHAADVLATADRFGLTDVVKECVAVVKRQVIESQRHRGGICQEISESVMLGVVSLLPWVASCARRQHITASVAVGSASSDLYQQPDQDLMELDSDRSCRRLMLSDSAVYRSISVDDQAVSNITLGPEDDCLMTSSGLSLSPAATAALNQLVPVFRSFAINFHALVETRSNQPTVADALAVLLAPPLLTLS